MVSVTCVPSHFLSSMKNPSPISSPIGRIRPSVIPTLTLISKMTGRIKNTMLNFIPEATSIIKQVLTIYLNTIFLTSNLVISIEKNFWQSKTSWFLRQLIFICCCQKKYRYLRAFFSVKVSFEEDFLSCLHQLFEIEESEIYGDYLQLRELVSIDKKFVDRNDLLIRREGKSILNPHFDTNATFWHVTLTKIPNKLENPHKLSVWFCEEKKLLTNLI